MGIRLGVLCHSDFSILGEYVDSIFRGNYWNVCTNVDQKHLESFEMWCWRRMETISWTDHVRNEEVLLRVKEQRNILHEIRKRKAN